MPALLRTTSSRGPLTADKRRPSSCSRTPGPVRGRHDTTRGAQPSSVTRRTLGGPCRVISSNDGRSAPEARGDQTRVRRHARGVWAFGSSYHAPWACPGPLTARKTSQGASLRVKWGLSSRLSIFWLARARGRGSGRTSRASVALGWLSRAGRRRASCPSRRGRAC